MNFNPKIAAEVEVEDHMVTLLGWVVFTNQQVVRIRTDDFDQIDEIGIDVLEK